MIVSKRFCSEQQLEKDHTHAPDIHFLSYLGTVLIEALRCLIPVSSYSLRRQFNLFMTFINDLTEAKICDFNLTKVENDVLWLQIVVNNFLFRLIQILKTAQNLRDYQLGFLLGYLSILLKVKVKIRA